MVARKRRQILLEWATRRAPVWSRLLRLLKSRFFASLPIWLLLLPVLAKVIHGFPEVLHLNIDAINGNLPINLSLPFSWYALYLSAVLFYASWILFIIFCPEFLRDFDDAGDAISKGVTVQRVREIGAQFVGSYFSNRRPTQHEFQKLLNVLRQYRANADPLFVSQIGGQLDANELQESIANSSIRIDTDTPGCYVVGTGTDQLFIEREQLLKHIFWDLRSLQEISFPIVRSASALLLLLGAVLVSCVFVHTFLFVVSEFWKYRL